MAAIGPTILRKSTRNIDVTVRLEQQVSVVFVCEMFDASQRPDKCDRARAPGFEWLLFLC